MSDAYNTLLNKYNTLVARCQSMQETIKTKDEQWASKSEEFKSIEDNARTLCKLILAKDKSQINLGTETGSWGTLATRDLIVQATQSYKKYNKERALALQQILDMAEERQAKIEGLLDQIAFYENNSGDSERYEDAVKREADKKDLEEAVNNADYQTQQDLKNNNVQISIVNDNEGIGDLIASTLDELDSIKPMSQSVPIKDSSGVIAVAREKQRQKQVFKKYSAEIDIGRYISDMSQIQKDFIEVIGSKGLSEQTEITKALQEMDEYKDKNKKYFTNSIYVASRELQGMGVIIAEGVTIPLEGKSNCKIIRLTELGMRIYFLMTDKKPVLAEANYIQTEHDNIHHGYGIKAIYQGVEASGLYSHVNMNCRKNPLIVDPQRNRNITYIPDIIAVMKDVGWKCYFEYERGFSSKDTIIEKCNKMVRFTRNLYFITDTKEHVESLLKNLIAWKKEAVKRHLKVKVYISTARYFQSQNFDIRGSWMYVLPENSAEPVKDPKA